MSITYPTSLDSLPNPTNTDLMENATTTLDHDQQHSNANDAIEALEAKVGINGSAVTTTHDYKLSAVTGSAKALTAGTSTQSVTNLTLVTPTLTLTSDATGDLYYRNSGGAFTRLPIGSAGNILDVSAGGIPEWIANPSAADATYVVKGVRVLDAGAVYYAADAGSNDTYAITLSPAPTAYAAGQTFRFKANTVNTGAATINVNSLGAKTIVKGVNTTLADGDIAAGQFCTLIYDGTNFVLQNPTSNTVIGTLYENGVDTVNATNSATVVVTHNLGVTPKRIFINSVSYTTTSGNIGKVCMGVWDSSGQSSTAQAGTASASDLPISSTTYIMFYPTNGSVVSGGIIGTITSTQFTITITGTISNYVFNFNWSVEA